MTIWIAKHSDQFKLSKYRKDDVIFKTLSKDTIYFDLKKITDEKLKRLIVDSFDILKPLQVRNFYFPERYVDLLPAIVVGDNSKQTLKIKFDFGKKEYTSIYKCLDGSYVTHASKVEVKNDDLNLVGLGKILKTNEGYFFKKGDDLAEVICSNSVVKLQDGYITLKTSTYNVQIYPDDLQPRSESNAVFKCESTVHNEILILSDYILQSKSIEDYERTSACERVKSESIASCMETLKITNTESSTNLINIYKDTVKILNENLASEGLGPCQ